MQILEPETKPGQSLRDCRGSENAGDHPVASLVVARARSAVAARLLCKQEVVGSKTPPRSLRGWKSHRVHTKQAMVLGPSRCSTPAGRLKFVRFGFRSGGHRGRRLRVSSRVGPPPWGVAERSADAGAAPSRPDFMKQHRSFGSRGVVLLDKQAIQWMVGLEQRRRAHQAAISRG